MDEEKILSAISDGNVEKLRRANEILKHPPGSGRPIPGSRPDGGMAPIPTLQGMHNAVQHILETETRLRNELIDAHNLVDNFEKSTIELESKVAQLEAQLDAERSERMHYQTRCVELHDVLRKAAAIMVNGEKAKEQ